MDTLTTRAVAAYRAKRLIESWTRRAEIVEYARRNSIELDVAVNQLVNSGLSHYRGPSLCDRM